MGARLLAAVVLSVFLAGCGVPGPQGEVHAIGRPPRVTPDLAGTTLPPNLAPLNFRVCEDGSAFRVTLQVSPERTVEVSSSDGRILIPPPAWRDLLSAGRGGAVQVTVRAFTPNLGWSEFAPFSFAVAADPVDDYLVYRRITPQYNLWTDVGVYQRHLPSFAEGTVLSGLAFKDGCTNCHAFACGNPATMSIATRSEPCGSVALVVHDGRLRTLDAKWGYTGWHPAGRFAAYSLNHVTQFFHAVGAEVRDVVDLDSEIVIYDTEKGDVFTAPALADPQRLETYPTWSADGRTLFFCSAPLLWEDRRKGPPARYAEVRYDLKKASFDPATRTVGPPETVLAAETVGKSILLPRVSPEGRFLVCCLCDYGCFPIFQPSSDLYLLDLQDGSLRELSPLNSPLSESYHSWSSNGRWLAFSSKRQDGVWTRTYLAHCDASGQFAKPFILPQRDPDFYDGYLKTFTVPEFATAPVPVGSRALARAARTGTRLPVALPATTMSPKAGAAQTAIPWQAGSRTPRR